MSTEIAILLGAALATIGWAFTARWNRRLSRKQHTINVILQANFNSGYLNARSAIAPMVKEGKCPDGVLDGTDSDTIKQLRRILNHHEFVAAGVRNGDLDEFLLRDTERAAYVELYGVCDKYIWSMRDGRSRQSLYEHLEWLHARWTDKPPSRWQRAYEGIIGKPHFGERAKLK